MSCHELIQCYASSAPSWVAFSQYVPLIVRAPSRALSLLNVKPLLAVHDREFNRNVKPTLNNDSLRLKVKKNCKNMCFTLESDEYIVCVFGG